jgi:hypothetical protein
MFVFEELDATTRGFMLREFDSEEAGTPYRSSVLSAAGLAAFPGIMRNAIQSGNETTLYQALANPLLWQQTDRGGRRVNAQAAAERLAYTEFNTWYVRGLAARLIAEGVEHCEVYRAARADQPRCECAQYIGRLVPVLDVYNGHRARYWPAPGDPRAFSIPTG